MAGIIWWNLNDGVQWMNEGSCRGCLCNSELNEKPAYQRLYQLIKRRFMTSRMTESSRDGIAEISGFCGDYTGEIVCGDKKGRFAFRLGDNPEQITAVLE